jgi:primosomal replication protein N
VPDRLYRRAGKHALHTGGNRHSNLILEHASSIEITGQAQQVKAITESKAFGSLAERLAGQAIGSIWKFSGHLASPRNGKQVYLHIQDIAASP